MTLGCTLEELGARMSLHEFCLWQQFDAQSPLPDIRSDIHSAQVTTAVINMAGKSRAEPVTVRSQVLFLPDDKPAKRANSPADLFKKGRK